MINVQNSSVYTCYLMLLTVYGTEWPILCWRAIKKLVTHSHLLTVTCSDWHTENSKNHKKGDITHHYIH